MAFAISKGVKCCKDCIPPKRQLGCHSKCEEYIKEKAENDALNKKIRAIKSVDEDYVKVKKYAVKRKEV